MLQICVSLGDISYPFCNVLYTIVLYFTSIFDTMLHCTVLKSILEYAIVLCCIRAVCLPGTLHMCIVILLYTKSRIACLYTRVGLHCLTISLSCSIMTELLFKGGWCFRQNNVATVIILLSNLIVNYKKIW